MSTQTDKSNVHVDERLGKYMLKNSSDFLQIVQDVSRHGLVQVGCNVVIKKILKKKVDFVIVAADADPVEIVLNFPDLCEDKNIPFVVVSKKKELSRSCLTGKQRSRKNVVVACVLVDENLPNNLKKQVTSWIQKLSSGEVF